MWWFRVAGGLWFVITGCIGMYTASNKVLSLSFLMGVLALVAGVALLVGF
jgi:hypothetical protein